MRTGSELRPRTVVRVDGAIVLVSADHHGGQGKMGGGRVEVGTARHVERAKPKRL